MRRKRKSEFEEVLQSINYKENDDELEAKTEEIIGMFEKKPAEESKMEATALLNEDYSYFSIGYSMNIGKRKNQQDSVVTSADNFERPCKENKILGVLSDGMGGLSGGEIASALCTGKLLEFYNEEEQISDYPTFFRDSIVEIDMMVKNLKNDEGLPLGGGATLIAFAIDNDNLYWATVGDSHLYIVRGNEIVLVNREHNYMMRLMERVKSGEITLAQAQSDKRREALISFMGIGGLKIYDINKAPFKLQKNDIVLACSDGLYRTLSDEEIKDAIIGCNDDMQLLSHVLITKALAKERRNQDNVSVVAIKNL